MENKLYKTHELNDGLNIFEKIEKWGEDRNFYGKGGATVQSQYIKLCEEAGEMAGNISKGRDITDDIGDAFVVLVHIARLSGKSLLECAEFSYNEIKDRKGEFRDGSYIKESDL